MRHGIPIIPLTALLFAAGCGREAGSARKQPDLETRVRVSIDRHSPPPPESAREASRIVAEEDHGVQAETGAYAYRAALVTSPTPIMQHWTNPLGEEEKPKDTPVGMRIIDRHIDRERQQIRFTVVLRNRSEAGLRVRLYAFGYDRNNRLVQATDKALYFQPREQMLQTYSFRTRDEMTRWVLAVR